MPITPSQSGEINVETPLTDTKAGTGLHLHHTRVPAEFRAATAEKRAGDRGRTGDVQLGKLAFYH